MERRQPGGEPAPEYRLSRETARQVADRAGPPRPRRTFLSTDHLSTEAAAAYVDGMLPPAGQVRADAHLELCDQCRREVDGQREARRALRGSGPIRMPSDLRDRLRDLGGEAQPPSGRGADGSGIGRGGRGGDGERRLGDGYRDGLASVDGSRPDGLWSRLMRRLRGFGH